MEEIKKVLKKTCYLLMIVTLTIMTLFSLKFVETEVNAAIISSEYSKTQSYTVEIDKGRIKEIFVNGIRKFSNLYPASDPVLIDLEAPGDNRVKVVTASSGTFYKNVIWDETAIKVSAVFSTRTATRPIITRGNWTSTKQYVFTANKAILEYSLDGDGFIAIDAPIENKYTVSIGDDLPHDLVLKDTYGDLSDAFPIEAKATGNDNLMFYASQGLFPWDSDSNWEYSGTGSITPNILNADGTCKKEYGEGAVCYKIYDLDVDGEQVKVLQQLDYSNTVILEMSRQLDVNDYKNLYRYGGSVRGRVIVPNGDTYAGIGNPNTGNYAGNNYQLRQVASVGLQFEPGIIPGSNNWGYYGFVIRNSGSYVMI